MAFRNAEKLGDLVAMDLKIRTTNGKDILYILDHATSFILATLINNKKPETIAAAVNRVWYAHGMPFIKCVLSDNGKEFTEAPMIQMMEMLNIKHEVTAAYTPQQNGGIERIHAIVDMNMEMLMEGSTLSEENALCMAVNAYNQMELKSGFSPAFLVYNVATAFPSILEIAPPQLESFDEEVAPSTGDFIKAREIAMKNHLEIRMSDKLRRAILAKTRSSDDIKQVGELVYFKRAKEDRWRGPGVVADSIRGQCSVKMGRQFYSCRHEDLVRATRNEIDDYNQVNSGKLVENNVQVDQQEQRRRAESEDQNTWIETEYAAGPAQPSVAIGGENDEVIIEGGEVTVQQKDNAENTSVSKKANPGTTSVYQKDVSGVTSVHPNGTQEITSVYPEDKSGENGAASSQQAVQVTPSFDKAKDLKRGDKIQFKLDQEGDHWITSRVLNRYRKGKRKGEWFTCEINKKPKVVNLEPGTFIWRKCQEEGSSEDVHDQLLMKECNIQEDEIHEVYATKVPHNMHHLPFVVKAKEKEHNTLKEFNTYNEVREDQLSSSQRENVIGSIWVIVNKELMGETVCKARICCRGDMESVEIRTDSPTICKASERLLLTVAASKGYKLQSLDFKAAFLQGKDLEREVILIPPKDLIRYENGVRVLWRLNKAMYGLVDASRNFNQQLDNDLREAGCIRSTFDKALYFYYDDQELVGLLALHVDDVCFAGNTKFQKEIINKIVVNYTVGRIESTSFNFTGWNLRQDSSGIVLSQQSYLEKLSAEDFSLLSVSNKEKTEPLDAAGQQLFRKGVGSLGWVAQVSRPDLAFQHLMFSTKAGHASVEDGRKLARVLNKLSETQYEIRFQNLGNIEDLKLVAFEDASPAQKDNVNTTIGSIQFLMNEEGRMNVIEWKSKRLDIPCSSPLAAEGEAALDTYGRIKFTRELIKEMIRVKEFPAELITDSISLKHAVESDNAVKDKRTGVAVCTLRKCKEFENIGVSWVDGKNQLADVFTKPNVNTLPLIEVLQGGRFSFPEEPTKEKRKRKTKKKKN